MTENRPSELEMQVLTVLWDHGPCTVRQMMQQLPDGKTRAYTTVLTVLQVMEKKRLVGHTRKGQAYLYRPLVTREHVVTPVVKKLLQNVFGGDPGRAVQALLDSGDVGDDELKQIRKVINRAARQSRKRGKKP